MVTRCLNSDELQIYHNPNGTISAYSILTGAEVPYQLTKPCCENIGGTFDVITQRCFYSKVINGCDYSLPFNLILNPKGNDGAIFSNLTDESCSLEVEFDYLFKFDCDKLTNFINGTDESTCPTLDSIFEHLGASMSIDKVIVMPYGTRTESIYKEEFFTPIDNGNLLSYLQDNSGNTGFYICQLSEATSDCNDLDLSDDVFLPRSNCATFAEQILLTHPTIPVDSFGSNWLTFRTQITDEAILSGITDEKIKLSITISGFCIDMCILIDNIKLNQKCTKELTNEIFVTKSPGFELDKIIDNKKSWVRVTETTHREFSINKSDGTQQIRQTDYYLDNEKQILNTKEIDLDIDIASAVENDVWCYISDNPCILTGFSECIVYTSSTIGIPTCVTYTLTNTGDRVGTKNYQYTECDGLLIAGTLEESQSVTFCAENDTVIADANIEIVVNGSCGTIVVVSGSTGYTTSSISCCDPTYQPVTTTMITYSGFSAILTGTTGCCSGSCGDDGAVSINNLLTQPLSGVSTIEDFQYYLTSELIDVKNRQTITSYPTLRLLYDRYMDSLSFCSTKSAAFDYYSMERFGNLVGNYWVDLIEQVIPATTIWGSTRIYTNTIFDGQKHRYKAYTSFFGTPVFLEPNPQITGVTSNVGVITSVITGDTRTLPQFNQQTYSLIYLTQMNSGSEFIGTIKVIGKNGSPCSDDGISECELTVSIVDNMAVDGTLTAVPSNYNGTVTYTWTTPSSEEYSQIISPTVNGIYIVKVVNDCCEATASIEITSF